MLNRCVLIGRLTKDPESKYTQSGIAIANFRIAVDRPYKNQETGEKETDFFPVVAWRQTAEFVCQYITKGCLVAVSGRMQNRSWVGQDGQQHTMTELQADEVRGLSRPQGQNGEPGQGPQAPAQRPQGQARQQQAQANDFDEVDAFADE